MQRVVEAVKRVVIGTPLETPARRLALLASSPGVRKNSRDDDVLRALIRSLPADACCVDVGANVGHILEAMVTGCPAGRHVAFEPVPRLADDLRRRFPEVDVRCTAVADEPGRTTFTIVPAKPSRSGISATLDLTLDVEVQEIETEIVTLDSALPPDYHPAMVKVDVEGAELKVLRGALRILTADRPIVALEHQYGRRREPDKTFGIYDLLDDLGYELALMSGDRVSRARFVDLVAAGSEWNFVGYPRDRPQSP